MNIEREQKGAVSVLRPDEPIVAEHVDLVKTELLNAFRETLGRTVVDMSKVPFIDIAGLEALVDVSEVMEGSGNVLKLCDAKPTIREVLHLTGIEDRFDQFDSVSDAVRSFL